MSHPNSSILALFDPIQNSSAPDTTPIRQSTIPGDASLSMSSFFNRINAQPIEIQHPVTNNLIDFSFDLGDVKSAILNGQAPIEHSRILHLGQTDLENRIPTKSAPNSPRKQRNAHTPPSPSKRLRNIDGTAARPRRSSLDASTISIDLKHRLAAADMSFDILRDEVSFLTNMAEDMESAKGTPLASSLHAKSTSVKM